MIKWKKIGKIFCANNEFDWMKTHASNPVSRHISGDIYRIYFSVRDEQNRSSISYVDIDINNPTKIITKADKPVLTFGNIGLFDDMGVSMGCITKIKGETYLYYLGWNITKTAPWHNAIGAAKEQSDGTFKKISLAPILDRCDCDPYSLSYPWIFQEDDKYHMWYGSNLSWGTEQKSMKHLIKYAYSNDGINWIRNGDIAINFHNDNEYAMSKPCVIKDNNIWKMWYSFRGESYRIGYAESEDAKNWIRKDDQSGITISDETSWDHKTVEYPCVFQHENRYYMLYNGNDYGSSGFGIAVAE